MTTRGIESEDAWAPTDHPYGMAAEEDPKSASVQFRVQGQWVALARELREDVESAYYGLYPSYSALYRDILIKGLIAMAEHGRRTSNRGRELRLREAALSRIVHSKSLRQRVEELVEPLIRTLKEDIEAGDIGSAADLLDQYLADVAKVEGGRAAYAEGLLLHHEFQKLRRHHGLRQQSALLVSFEEEYVKD